MHGFGVAEPQRVGVAERECAGEQAAGAPVAEDHRGEADVPAAAGLAGVEPAGRHQRQESAADAGEPAGDDDRDVLVEVDVDAERLGRLRVLAARPQPQAERRAPQHPGRDRHQREHHDAERRQAGGERTDERGDVGDEEPALLGEIERGVGDAGHGDLRGRVAGRSSWRGPPPSRSGKIASARNVAAPAPMRLIATPDTMWSTPNVTVATACSRPPMTPNSAAPITPTQGPPWYVKNAAPQVPRIICPSRPMLTTPARSAQSPPSAAIRIGQVAMIAARMVPAEEMSSVSETMRTSDTTAMPASTSRNQCCFALRAVCTRVVVIRRLRPVRAPARRRVARVASASGAPPRRPRQRRARPHLG